MARKLGLDSRAELSYPVHVRAEDRKRDKKYIRYDGEGFRKTGWLFRTERVAQAFRVNRVENKGFLT